MLKRGDDVLFARTTLGIATLLENPYIKHYPLSQNALAAIVEVRRRRNLIHFAEPYSWAVDRNLLELVGHLNHVIPPKQVRRAARSGA